MPYRGFRRGIGAQLGQQGDQANISGNLNLPAQALQNIGPPRVEIDDPWGHSTWVKRKPQHIDRSDEKVRIGPGHQRRDGAIGCHQIPAAIHGQRRERFMPGQDQVDGLAGRGQRRVVQITLRKRWGKTRGDQQGVALPKRHLQPFSESQHHVPTGRRTARLHETQVARRDVGVERQIKLAQMATLAPGAKVIAEGIGRQAHAPISIGSLAAFL